MKILYVSGLYPAESLETLRDLSANELQNAANVFQWAVVDGLVSANAEFQVVSYPFLPTYPRRFKQMYTPEGLITSGRKVVGKMMRYCALPLVKELSIRSSLVSYVEDWICSNASEDRLVVLIYTPYPPFISAVNKLKKKYHNLEIASIVTDLVDDLASFAGNRVPYKWIQSKILYHRTRKLYRYIDKYVLLTKAMEERIPEAIGRNIVIEGLYSKQSAKSCAANRECAVLYAGTFQRYGGLEDLVEAFMMTTDPAFRLYLCGSGVLTEYVKERAAIDTRIKYMGMLPHDQVLALQQQVRVLVNPRKPDDSITRFSFPSKTIEYMASGTPMIGYPLAGIPSEYYEYMFIPNELSRESMTELINQVLSLHLSSIIEKGAEAAKFISENKTALHQVTKILNFLSEDVVK